MKLQDTSWATSEAQTLSGRLDRRTVVRVRSLQQVSLLAATWPAAAITGGSDNQVFGGIYMGGGELEGEDRPILTVIDTSHGCFVLVPQSIIEELPLERIAQTSEGDYPAKFRGVIERILRRANEGRYRDDYPYMGIMAETMIHTLSAAGKQTAHWTLFYDESIWDYGFVPNELLDATQLSLEPHKWVLSRLAGVSTALAYQHTDIGPDEWDPLRANPLALMEADLTFETVPSEAMASTLLMNAASNFLLDNVRQVVQVAWDAEEAPGSGQGTYGPTLGAIEAAIRAAELTQVIAKSSQSARSAYLRAMVYPLVANEGSSLAVALAEAIAARATLAQEIATLEQEVLALDENMVKKQAALAEVSSRVDACYVQLSEQASLNSSMMATLDAVTEANTRLRGGAAL